ncbi:nucleotide disphospho-sugar-binding domain-containing protein [Actinoallomurus sp. CA-150999]|uniref:nucleotide disphospho-sugar-binding domain-containing protein n=1 Tax=Actinoallomurus sp. CA-150999 TaxID=3239887 RepID=UPI003D9295E0
MRVMLGAVWPTHLMSMVPVAWALRAAGHDVIVAGRPDVTPVAEAAGLPIGVLEGGEPADPRGAAGRLGSRRSGVHGGRWEEGWDNIARRWVNRADDVLDAYLSFARDWRPDLVVTDPLEFSGLIVGGVLGVPAVRHRFGPEVLITTGRDVARRALHDHCVRAGLETGLPDPALTLDPCPPSLQHPDAAPARTVRYIAYNGPGTLPTLPDKRPGARRVLVCLGTRSLALDGRLSILRNVVRACGELPGVEAVVTCVPEYHGALLEVAPDSVHVIDPTPINLLLDDCDAMVVYGGAGTLHTGLSFGLPQLVVPSDHHILVLAGERVEASGTGRMVPGAAVQADHGAAKDALAAILDDSAYRAGAQKLRDEIDRQPTPADLVPELERLAG